MEIDEGETTRFLGPEDGEKADKEDNKKLYDFFREDKLLRLPGVNGHGVGGKHYHIYIDPLTEELIKECLEIVEKWRIQEIPQKRFAVDFIRMGPMEFH